MREFLMVKHDHLGQKCAKNKNNNLKKFDCN